MPIEESTLREVRALIEKNERLLIVPHANVDPDGLSSALACALLFTDLGKTCTVLCPDSLPESLSFLPGFDTLRQEINFTRDFLITLDGSHGVEVETLKYTREGQKVNIIVTPKGGMFRASDLSCSEGDPPFDLLVIVDTAELALLGAFYEENRSLFEQLPILNIDHHISNSTYGELNLIDPNAASATEVLYRLFESRPEWSRRITPDIATLLLAGLITDTRSFQNPNTTPDSLEVAAELLDRGARQQEIIRYIYKTKPLSTLKIWGRALNRIQTNLEERIVWTAVSAEDVSEMQSSSKETHGLIDDLLTTIPDADLYILFTELEEGGLKASLRTTEALDASAIAAKLFGGGGHARAAGFRVRTFQNFQMEVVECVRRIIEEMKAQRREKGEPELQDIPPAQKGAEAAQSNVVSEAVDVIQEVSLGYGHEPKDIIREVGEEK